MGKSSKDKGARGERELASLLRDYYGYDTRRGYVSQRQSDVVGLEGIHIEVKRVERLSISTAMRQAVLESGKRSDGIPTVFHRKNYGKWLVTMRLDDWDKFIETAEVKPEEVDTKVTASKAVGTLVTVTLADWMDVYGAWRWEQGL